MYFYRLLAAGQADVDLLYGMTQGLYKIAREHNMINLDLEDFIRGFESILLKYHELIEESHQFEGSETDIDSIDRRKRIYGSISQIIFTLIDTLRQNLKKSEKGKLFYGGKALSYLATPVTKSNSSEDSEGVKIVLPIAQIEDLGNHPEPVVANIRIQKILYKQDTKFLVMGWNFAKELIKPPKEGFFISSLVNLRVYTTEDTKTEILPETSSGDKILIKFPLRSGPEEDVLFEALRCIRVHKNEGHRIVSQRKSQLLFFRSDFNI